MKKLLFPLFSLILSLNISVIAQTPVNDNCSNASELIVGQEFISSYIIGDNSNCTASGELPIPSCSQFGNGQDIWFHVTVPESGSLIIETAYNNGIDDTAISIYEGNCGELSEISCDDDSGNNFMSLITVSDRIPGETILVRVFEYQNNNFGTFLIAAYDPSLASCDFPTDLNAYIMSETDVFLTWEDHANATSWEIQVLHEGEIPNQSGTLIYENYHNVSDLINGENYQFYVRAICEGGDYSNWSSGFSFQMSFPINNAPINALPISCGTTVSGDTTYATIAEEVEDCDEFPNNPTTSPDVWYSWVGNGDFVSLSTCNQASFDTSIGIYTGEPGSLLCHSATDDSSGCSIYTTTHEFFSTLDELYYIRVYGYNYNSVGTFDLTMNCSSSCVPPSEITATIIDANTTELSWNLGNSGTSCNVEWEISGFVQGEGNLVSNITETTFPITNLTEFQAYEFYIQSNCEDETGDWIGPIPWVQASNIIAMQENVFSTCERSLFTDSGGVTNNYFNGEEPVLILFPDDPSQKLQIEFLSFDCGNEGNYGDFLAIYDGQDDSYELLVSSTNVGNDGMLATFKATNEQGALTFIFDANMENTHAGWTGVLSCYSTVSNTDNTIDSFKLYPNPVISTLNLEAQQPINWVEIYNILGEKILSVTPNSNHLQLDINNIPTGSYILKTGVGSLIGVYTFVKK